MAEIPGLDESQNNIVVVGFETKYGRNNKPVDYVQYGERYSIQSQVVSARVSDLDPANLRDGVGSEHNMNMKRAFMINRWRQIEPAYNAWKSGQDLPVRGTPIDLLPGFNKHQLDEIKKAGFKAIEDLAESHEEALGKINLPDRKGLKKKAEEFLKAQDTGKAAEEINELKAQLDAAVEMIAELKASNDKPKGKASKKAAPAEEEDA